MHQEDMSNSCEAIVFRRELRGGCPMLDMSIKFGGHKRGKGRTLYLCLEPLKCWSRQLHCLGSVDEDVRCF